MVPEMEKPRITEIKVRMDCNGCVQKIKKALHGITGIYDLYIDFPQQKITIIGWADPEKIVKAIKKTRKSAVICSHVEQPDQPVQPTDAAHEGEVPEGLAPPPESNIPAEPPQTEAAPPMEGPNDVPPPENLPPETKPSFESADGTSQPTHPSKPKDVEEIHVIYHHPPDYGYRYAYGHHLQQSYGGQWNAYHNGLGLRGEASQPYANSPGFRGEASQPYTRGPGFRDETSQPYTRGPGFRDETSQPYTRGSGFRDEPSQPYTRGPGFRDEPPQPYSNHPGFGGGPPQPYSNRPGLGGEPSQPIYVTHSYNTYKPSPYVTEYAYPRSPPRYSHYSRPDHNSQDYYSRNSGNGSGSGNGNGNITSMFSEENPNACRII